MGLLDSLFDSSTYGGDGGLLSRLLPMTGAIPQSQGFPDQGPTFAQRFQPAIDAPLAQPASFAQRFQPATDNPLTPMAGNINVGGYSMPRIGNPTDYAAAPDAALPPNAQPTQGQLPPVTGAALPPQTQQLPPALGGNQIGGNFGAGFQNFIGSPGGLLGKVAGGITGALTGQRTDPAGMQQQNLKAQYDALLPVVGPQKALLAVLNPEAGKTILNEALTNKEEVKTVKDAFGNEHLVWVNPRTQQAKPLEYGNGAGGSGAPGADLQGMTENISRMAQSGATRQEMLQQVPADFRGHVEAVLSGRALPTNIGRSPARAAIMAIAHAIDSNFDESTIPLRFKTQADYAPNGQSGRSIVALNTVQHHLGVLSDAVDNPKLGDSGWTYLNAVRNGIARNTPLDKDQGQAIQRVQDAMKAVTDEMSAAYKAGRVSDAEIKQWQDLANTNMPLRQLKQGIADFVDLLNGKRDQLNETHQQIIGTEAPGINKDLNSAITKKVHERNAGEATTEKAPTVSEGMTATNPQTGQKIVFKGGKWVPVQ